MLQKIKELLELIIALFGLLSILLTPVIEWFLLHRGISARTKQINALLNKIEQVEKLRSIQKSSSDPLRIKNVVQFCRDDILQRFEALMPIEPRWPMVPGEGLPGWRRFLLMYKQPSLKGRAYRVNFYMFSFVGLVVGPVCFIRHCLKQTVKDNWYFVVIGMAFYLVLALLCRTAAIQNYKKTAEKLAAQKKVLAN